MTIGKLTKGVILMKGFQSIVGHEEIIKHMRNSIAMGKVSHSYIFAGEPGAGKKLLAKAYAMTLQCEAGKTDPCMKCDSCKRAASKNHPDIIYLTHEKPNTISVEEVRTQIVEDVAIKPYYGKYKIYIIPDCEKMTAQAQNAILKTIEEPPAYAIFLLITNNIELLLPTIQSRCVRLDVKAVSDALVKEYLMEHLHVPDYQAEVDASFAQGNIGKAEAAATSSDFEALTKRALYVLKNAQNMEINELIDVVKELSADKHIIYDYLDLFQIWYRDVLMFKATREIDNLVYKQEINEIRHQAKERSYEGLENILDGIEKAKVRLRANANFDTVMELLFLTIRDK